MTLDLLIEDIKKTWSAERYGLVHKPYVITKVPVEVLTSPKPNVLDMPIKLPGGDFQVTYDDAVKTIVGLCVAFEQKINPDWEEYYCYLTMNQSIVLPGKTQRNAGVHFDGMQGSRYPENLI